MILNYLLITLRSMVKNKIFIITNVLGMGVAIAICIVTYLAHQYDATFDGIHTNSVNIYRVNSVREFENTFTPFGYAPMPLGEIAHKTLKDVIKSTRYENSGSNFKRGDDLFAANISYVDPDFFEMFHFTFINNSSKRLTREGVFVSENMAIRLFGTPEEALDKNILQVYGKELKAVTITAVFREPPVNSSFFKRDGSAFMHIDNFKDEFKTSYDDWKDLTTLFVQVNDPSRLNSVHRQLQPFIALNNKVRDDFQIAEFKLVPFSTMAHADRDGDVRAATWAAPPVAAVIGSVIMAIMILLIACFNLTNTAIAISSSRLKEIGIRKVLGSMRVQLIGQFIGETAVICLLAMVIGMSLADPMIEAWNLMTNNNIHLESHDYIDGVFMTFMIAVLLFTALVAGSYPAFYISKFKPVSILKGKVRFGGTNNFTRVLLGLQFTISLMAIICAIGFMQNAQYQKNFDLGFHAKGSVIAWVNDGNEFGTYRNALQLNADIASIAGAKTGISSYRLHDAVKYQSSQVEVDIIEVGDNYLTTLGLTLTAGRDFIKDSETDVSASVIVTQKMADLFRWKDPLGKQVIWKDSVKLFVVGVVQNVYTQGLWRALDPMMIRYVKPEQYTQIVVSTREDKVAAVDAFMKSEWNKVFPNRLYNGYMMGQGLQEVESLNQSIMYGYAFLGLVAMILSATGLYSLLSLNIIKRTKEIGIRKISGASVLNITRIINTEFVVIITIASITGSVAAYNWCSVIMGAIWKYYQPAGASSFVMAIVLVFTVSFFTIGHKLMRVARMNPIDTLRDE